MNDILRGINTLDTTDEIRKNYTTSELIANTFKFLSAYASLTQKPVVLFWDEITSLLETNSYQDSERDEILNVFKTVLGNSQDDGLLILGTGNTNLSKIPDSLVSGKRFTVIEARVDLAQKIKLIEGELKLANAQYIPDDTTLHKILGSFHTRLTNNSLRDIIQLGKNTGDYSFVTFIRDCAEKINQAKHIDASTYNIEKAEYLAAVSATALYYGILPFFASTRYQTAEEMIIIDVPAQSPFNMVALAHAYAAGYKHMGSSATYMSSDFFISSKSLLEAKVKSMLTAGIYPSELKASRQPKEVMPYEIDHTVGVLKKGDVYANGNFSDLYDSIKNKLILGDELTITDFIELQKEHLNGKVGKLPVAYQYSSQSTDSWKFTPS
jgi:hypothetical protein